MVVKPDWLRVKAPQWQRVGSVKEILRVPDRYTIPMMVATGYEYNESDDAEKNNSNSDDYTPRLPMEEVVFEDTFGEPYLHVGDEDLVEEESLAS